jgi:hypothetical protein
LIWEASGNTEVSHEQEVYCAVDGEGTSNVAGDRQEAQVIALRLGPPPQGYANWTLRLLARKVVALEIAESVSYETVRRTLKKTG